ncbi:MAG: sulfatase-like hydrolase/transferase [Bacteroidetes bacterium]|nr:sulfatase-like hydrolase/transferase [Bacteroidota bacterium]
MSKPHHIFLIVADSLRKDSVYAQGSPGLPYSEANGTQFTQARSAACWTLPATSCLFTGMDVHEHGADTHTRQLKENIPTLAEKLKAKGYKTIQVTANQVTTEVFGLDKGFDEIHKVWQFVVPRFNKIVRWGLSMTKPRVRKLFFSKDVVHAKLLSDIQAANCWGQTTHRDAFDRARTLLAEADKTNQPCFVFINLMETHFPYHIDDIFKFKSEGLLDKFREGWSLFNVINMSFLHSDTERIKPKFREIIRQRQATAWTLIREDLDNFMREQHEDKNNLVVFCSDHGDNFGELNWYYHFANVNEAGNRVPLFWLENGEKKSGVHSEPISSKFIHQSILKKVDEDQPTTLFENNHLNFPILQSYWYKHHSGTMEKYKYNQFLFSEGNTRYLMRNKVWLTAPITEEVYNNEPQYEPLDGNTNPIEELKMDSEKKKLLETKVANFIDFSDKMKY